MLKTNLPTKREHDLTTDQSVTKKQKPNLNSIANSNRVHNKAQPVNKRRRRHRSRPNKAQKKRALETETVCTQNLPRKKQKHNPQALQQKVVHRPFADKTNTLEDLCDKSCQDILSHTLHTQASCQYQSSTQPKHPPAIEADSSKLPPLCFQSPIAEILLDIQAAFPLESSSQPMPSPPSINMHSNQSTIAGLVPLSPPMSLNEITNTSESVLSKPEGVFSPPESVLNKPEGVFSPPASVLNKPDNPKAVPDDPDSIILLSSSEEEDNNDNAISISDSDSDAEDASDTTDFIKHLGMSLTDHDLAHLNPSRWLNDSVIDFSAAMFQRTFDPQSTTHISSSFFFTRLLQEYQKGNDFYEKTKKWFKNTELFDKKLWLIPVCQRSHWYLIAVVRPGSSNRSYITIMNSLLQHRLEEAALIKEFLRRKLREDKGEELEMHDIINVDIPQQSNFYDCGLFLLRSIEVLLRKRNRFLKLIKGEINEKEAEESIWQRIPVYTRDRLRGQIFAFAAAK